jgi:hypothetical protein
VSTSPALATFAVTETAAALAAAVCTEPALGIFCLLAVSAAVEFAATACPADAAVSMETSGTRAKILVRNCAGLAGPSAAEAFRRCRGRMVSLG